MMYSTCPTRPGHAKEQDMAYRRQAVAHGRGHGSPAINCLIQSILLLARPGLVGQAHPNVFVRMYRHKSSQQTSSPVSYRQKVFADGVVPPWDAAFTITQGAGAQSQELIEK